MTYGTLMSILEERGYAVVPKECSSEMLKLACERLDAADRKGFTIQEWYKHLVEIGALK